VRIAFYDPRSGGHKPALIRGLVATAIELGHEPIVIGAHVDDLPTETTTIPFTYSNSFVYPFQARQLYKLCAQQRLDLFVDLTFDNSVWGFSRRLRQVARGQVHVVHKTRVFNLEGRSVQGKAMARYLRFKARRLIASGSAFVVHKQATQKAFGDIVGAKNVLALNYPTAPVAADFQTSDVAVPFILWVGRERPDKGLEPFLRGFFRTTINAELKIVGHQPSHIVELVNAQADDRVHLLNNYTNPIKLAELYASSSLVAVPYPEAMRNGGGASGVLLDALTHGKPVVVTPPVAELLPSDFAGMVIAKDNAPTNLAIAIESALERLPQLSAIAKVAGPHYIETEHRFTDYLSGIIALAGSHHSDPQSG